MVKRKVRQNHRMQVRTSNETYLLSEQALGNFPLCYRPKAKDVAQGAVPKCEIQQSKIFPTKRYCPGCVKHNNTMSSAKSVNARKLRNKVSMDDQEITNNTQSPSDVEDPKPINDQLSEVIISQTVESIQEVKDSLLEENERLTNRIMQLEAATPRQEVDEKESVVNLATRKVLDDRVREFSLKLIKEIETLKQDLAQSQANSQHHQITITQINARVSFLQDQVSSLTFCYTQESHAHNDTKLQLQHLQQLLQQQQQPQQQQQDQQQQPPQQQALPIHHQEDPLDMH